MKISVGLCLGLMLWLVGCTSSRTTTTETESMGSSDDSEWLIRFDRESISQSEFERVYQKNNGGRAEVAAHTDAQYREYLDLYINFKRKVYEAEALGLDTTESFLREFETYRGQLAQPYLTAKNVEDQLVREAYERSKNLVNANHLLLRIDAQAAPADTLAVYNRIMAIRDSVVTLDVDFETMARRHSDDPSASDNGGNLGYFTAFNMVYPFESAAFSTPVGEVSQPVRSRFGYHLIKVNDKIAREGTKTAAHIIVRIGDRFSAKDTAQAIARINEIYQQLENGADFAELARQYSDDPNSAPAGGSLGTQMLLPDMENRKLRLGEGEYSAPFTTPFGWHILKVTEVEPLPPFEEMEVELKRKVERDSRGQLGRKALINRIKKDYDYELETENLNALVDLLDENFVQGTWQPGELSQPLYQKVLFSLDKPDPDFERTIADFLDFYQKTRPRFPGQSPARGAEMAVELFAEQELLAYEESQLPGKYPEFRYLVQEYRDGILLFTLMEEKVWRRAVEDSTGLRNFYDNNRTDFTADERIRVVEYRTQEREAAREVARLLQSGASENAIDSMLNSQSSLRVTSRVQRYEKGDEGSEAAWFDMAVNQTTPILETEDGFRVLRVMEKYPAGVQAFDEVKPEVITRYQDYLEAEWLDELEDKYPAEVNEETFENLFSEE